MNNKNILKTIFYPLTKNNIINLIQNYDCNQNQGSHKIRQLDFFTSHSINSLHCNNQ